MARSAQLWVRLMERRRELGQERGRRLTTSEAAEMCGVPQSTYSRWENQVREPEDQYLDGIARYLGISRAEVVLLRAGEDPDELISEEVRQLRTQVRNLAEEVRLLRPDPPGQPDSS